MRYEADVAIIGGGIAGVSAACAAAKSGVSVILVERFAIVGGNSTTGGVASFCGETAGQGEVFDTIITELEKFKAVSPYVPYPEADHRNFDHEILAVIYQELLLRRNVKLLLHTRFVDVVVKDGKITEVEYNEIHKDGSDKKSDKKYNEEMSKAGTSPAIAYPEMEKQLLEKQEMWEVDATSGATYSLYRFRYAVTVALVKAQMAM